MGSITATLTGLIPAGFLREKGAPFHSWSTSQGEERSDVSCPKLELNVSRPAGFRAWITQSSIQPILDIPLDKLMYTSELQPFQSIFTGLVSITCYI